MEPAADATGVATDLVKQEIAPAAAPTVVWPVTSAGVVPGVTGTVGGDNVAYIQLDQVNMDHTPRTG